MRKVKRLKALCESEKHSLYQVRDIEKSMFTLKVGRRFFSILLNSKNGSRMFSAVSRTWNPVTGCMHECKYCWARNFVSTKLKNSKRYKFGFEPTLHEDFNKVFREDIVFVCDMGDLFGDWVPSDWIVKVMEYIRRFPKAFFLFLTKNPKRYHEFLDLFPENIMLGATIETNRDDIAKELSKAPPPSERYEAMKALTWPLKFISIEPIMDFDLNVLVSWIKEVEPFMVYIGYDNYDSKLPEPSLSKTEKLVETLMDFTIVVKKTMRPAWNESLTKYVKNGVQTSSC